MSDNHKTGNPPEPDYLSRIIRISLQIKVEKITENVPFLNFQKLRKKCLTRKYFRESRKIPIFEKNVFSVKIPSDNPIPI